MVGYTFYFMPGKSKKWAASPATFGVSGHEIKGVADHFGGFPTPIVDLPLDFPILGKPRKVERQKKKKVEKPQDGRQKSGQNIGNPYQMEDNKNPKGAALRGGAEGAALLSSIW